MIDPNLREEVDSIAQQARTRRLDISFNELLDMYRQEEPEIIIKPDFQRVFVWGEAQQSRFIESLLLELPIPPIYVVESDKEGYYELIDGLQRFSSYLHFRGELENKDRDIKRGDMLELEECDILKGLEGKKWTDLDPVLQIRLKRAFVTLQVIRKESDPNLKYHMFKRLNSGGTQISPHQIRNAYIRMLPDGARFMDFISELSTLSEYVLTVRDVLTENAIKREEDKNYVLRFMAFKYHRSSYRHDVDPYLDVFAEIISRKESFQDGSIFDYNEATNCFKKTFKIAANTLGDKSFTSITKNNRLGSGFAIYHFEAVSLGLQKFLSYLDPDNPDQMNQLRDVLENTRTSQAFANESKGGGRNTGGYLSRRIEIIEEAINQAFNFV